MLDASVSGRIVGMLLQDLELASQWNFRGDQGEHTGRCKSVVFFSWSPAWHLIVLSVTLEANRTVEANFFLNLCV